MKIRQLVLFSVLFLFTLSALAGDGKKYGKDLTVKEKTAIADILKNPQKFEGKRVLIEGEIEEVCQMMGCWIKVNDTTLVYRDNKKVARAELKAGRFVVVDALGDTIEDSLALEVRIVPSLPK